MELLVMHLARRFRRDPESDAWEQVADQLDAIGGTLSARERVLIRAVTLALDARDGWKRAWIKRANDSNEGGTQR